MTSLERKVDRLSAQVAALAEQQRKRGELVEELTPILKEVMATSTEKLSRLDEKGYFAFGRELLGVVEKVVEGYEPADVEALGNSIVAILDAVRAVTQPHVLKLAGEVGGVVESAENAEPVGMLGVVRATREQEVQRGLSVMIEILRHVGKGAEKLDRRARLQQRLASRRNATRPAAPRAARAAATRTTTSSRAPSRGPAADAPTRAGARVAGKAPIAIEGVAFTPEGYLEDPSQWSRELAVAIASQLGCELTERHFELIEFARKEYLEHGVSPNIRRLNKGSGIGTKEIYALFPKTPGKFTAMIAGIPKPVGCI